MKASTARLLIGLTLLLGIIGSGAVANASPTGKSPGNVNACSNLTGNSRIACMVVRDTSNRATLASFLRIYVGPLEPSKDSLLSAQLQSMYDALAEPATTPECISDIKSLVILPSISLQSRAFQAKNLFESWQALNTVLNAYDYFVSIKELGWRGPYLKRYFLDKVPSLTGVQKQWGEWAAKKAFELGEQTARRQISTQARLLISKCPGRYS